MNKPLVWLLVLVGGYLALDHFGAKWRSYLANDPYAPRLDDSAARQAIAEMDRQWKVAADHFATGEFAEAALCFAAGSAPVGGFTARYGRQPFADGKTLTAWLADHRSKWIAQLLAQQTGPSRALGSFADLGALGEMQRQMNHPQFDQLCAKLRADIARHIHAQRSALVVELAGNRNTPRRRKIAWMMSLRADEAPYLVFATAEEAASLGDLPFVGYVRLNSYDNLSPYDVVSEDAPLRDRLNGEDRYPVGIVQRIDFLLEPDPYARRNTGLTRRSCSSIEIKLPEYISLGERDPGEFLAAHREKITQSLDAAIAQWPKIALRSNPEYGFSSLERRSVMAGGVMPDATSDSAPQKTYTFLQ
jgi:hypothetical protein